MAILLAALSAMSSGTSDFLGGLASRRAAAITVSMVSHGMSAGLFVVLAPLSGGDPVATDLWWGAASGLGGAVGILALYRGFTTSRVGIVAPIAGVGTAALPVLHSVATGADLSGLEAAGMGLGLVAIALVSRQRSDSDGSVLGGVAHGIGAGVGLGFLLLALGQTTDDAGLWPLLPGRSAGFLLLVVIVFVTRSVRGVPPPARVAVVGVGVLSTAGNGLFLLGTQVGSLSAVAVVTSMFPAVTVLWARLVFREHLEPVQQIGLMSALVAVALIAAG